MIRTQPISVLKLFLLYLSYFDHIGIFTDFPFKKKNKIVMSLAIVTGANRNPGIGYEIVRGLASRLPTGSKAKRTNKRGVLKFY